MADDFNALKNTASTASQGLGCMYGSFFLMKRKYICILFSDQ
jgi:hypothetical protein